MLSDIYTRSGALVAFHDGKLIYDLHGGPVGQLRGSHAYCMAGHYVGELDDGIILGKNGRHRSIGAYVVRSRGQHKIDRTNRGPNELPKHISKTLR